MEIKVPEIGESIFEAEIGKWHKEDGERIAKDDLLCELETDKISLEVNAEADGILRIKAEEGQTVEVGAVIAEIEEGEKAGNGGEGREQEEGKKAKEDKKEKKERDKDKEEEKEEKERKKGRREAEEEPEQEAGPEEKPATEEAEERREKRAGGTPEEEEKTAGSGRRPQQAPRPEAEGEKAGDGDEDERTTRQRMSPIRRRIAERLLAARQQTAMLTTFNEADMARVLALRRKHGEEFEKKHGVPLGFMSFFVKAAVEALQEFPEVNARIDGEDIVYQHFYDIGIAVGGERGLVVPVLRDADRLHFASIEEQIRDFVAKVRENRISLEELEGGTFTITNGGVYGSLNSTPILNPPQSAVLGMHAIQERPVVVDGEIVARPMMYLALSYDHRLVDGRQAVQFLKRIKDLVEEPEEMLLEL